MNNKEKGKSEKIDFAVGKRDERISFHAVIIISNAIIRQPCFPMKL